MVSNSKSTLIHSSKGPRWRIDVHRPPGGASDEDFIVFVTGDLGDHVYRSRQMPMSIFRTLVNCITFVRNELPQLLICTDTIADFPRATTTTVAETPLFYVNVAISNMPDGRIEPTLAIYDVDDKDIPVLLARDDEIEWLYRDCKRAVVPFR